MKNCWIIPLLSEVPSFSQRPNTKSQFHAKLCFPFSTITIVPRTFHNHFNIQCILLAERKHWDLRKNDINLKKHPIFEILCLFSTQSVKMQVCDDEQHTQLLQRYSVPTLPLHRKLCTVLRMPTNNLRSLGLGEMRLSCQASLLFPPWVTGRWDPERFRHWERLEWTAITFWNDKRGNWQTLPPTFVAKFPCVVHKFS